MQVHLVGPDFDQVGAPQVGFPVAVVGFNRHYRLGTHGQHDRHGRLLPVDRQGRGIHVRRCARRPFDRETRTLKIRQADGTLREERLEIRRSVHGPVVFDENGVTIAMRVAGLDRPKMLEQWFRMGEARTLEEFQSASADDVGPHVARQLRRRQGPHHVRVRRAGAQGAASTIISTGREWSQVTRRTRCGPIICRSTSCQSRSIPRAGGIRMPTSRPG